METPKAFFSCRFVEEDKEIIDYFKSIARNCGVKPILATHPSPYPVSDKVRAMVEEVDCMVAIITPSAISDEVTSAWIYQEVGMAYALHLHIIPFVEQSIKDLGLIPNITDYVRFDRHKLHKVLDKALSFFNEVSASITGRSVQHLDDSTDTITKLEKYADIYDSRLFTNFPAKQNIAHCVLNNFISTHTRGIMLDSGTVTYTIADLLVERGLQIPIVTNNLAIVSKLKQIIHYPVFVLPGELDVRTQGVGGPDTAEMAVLYLKGEKKVTIDIAFLAANSIDPNNGLSADAPMFSDFRAAILRYARKVVLVLQGEKFLKPTSNPVIPREEWSKLLRKRASESSIWIVCHKLAKSYDSALENRYSNCINNFRDVLPPNHLIELGQTSKNAQENPDMCDVA